MGSRFLLSPVGTFVHPWVTKADTKFLADGLLHTDLDVPREEAQPVMDKIEAAAKAALNKHTDTMPPAKAKQWSIQLPFEEVLDDETGEPTGMIRFTFKQNAKIKLKDGSTKKITIEVRDAADNVVDTPVWGGDRGRVMFTMREIVVAQSSRAGVRLDFAKVQIVGKASSSMADAGFGEVEGGYVAKGRAAEEDAADNFTSDEDAGDY